MNGAPRSAEHGFPARLVVPGYYGTNSVKWLSRLHLADRRADSFFTTALYNDMSSAEDVAAGLPPRRPVWAIAPEAVLVAPAQRAAVPLGQPVDILGWRSEARSVGKECVCHCRHRWPPTPYNN